MNNRPLRDKAQRIIGYIETKPDGSQTGRDTAQRIKGYYYAKGNATRDASQRVVGYGNQLSSLITGRPDRLRMNHTPEIDNIDERVGCLVFSIQDRAWQIAQRAGIPADDCSLHNASIDDDLKGWCQDNPARLKAAKRAVRMIDGVWGISDLGHRITRRMLNAHPRRRGLKYDIEPRRPINVALLFGSTRQKIRNSVAL